MANKAFLGAREKKDLLEFVAGKGENYTRYLEWCDKNGIHEERRFSPSYFHRWVSRRRPTIRALAEQHNIEVRKASTLDKEKRIKLLEESVDRLTESLASETDAMTLIRLEEQLGKQLDRIAKERGEFQKPIADTDESAAANRLLMERALSFLKPLEIEAPAVDAEFREVPDATSAI